VLVKAALSANGALSVVELRADNLGTGIGTVTFSGAGSVSGTTPNTNIYYNPPRTPTTLLTSLPTVL